MGEEWKRGKGKLHEEKGNKNGGLSEAAALLLVVSDPKKDPHPGKAPVVALVSKLTAFTVDADSLLCYCSYCCHCCPKGFV